MSKRFRLSLTMRIFLITSILLIAACAITYGMIAYLTPITYTAILEDELNRKSDELIAELQKIEPQNCTTLLATFAGETGTTITVIDERGTVLFDNTPADSTVATSTEVIQSEQTNAIEDYAVSTETGVMISSMESVSEGDIAIVEDTTMIMAASTAESTGSVYSFAFTDGTYATLTIQGGMRAVNQAVEALGRVLPFLIIVILLISLAGSFFYARFITRPIVSISQIAHRMAALDLDARWEERRTDEIGALGESLNNLSDNLSQALLQLRDANRALQRDIDRERELDRQRTAFFSAASHELKTPITILKGQLSGMLAQVGIYRDREKYLARALEVTGRMENLVKEILAINRIGSNGLSHEFTAVNLSGLMSKQLELSEELIEQKGITLETQIDPDMIVRGDEGLLAKALNNVLMNAIVYSPSGASIHVEVKDRTLSIENTDAFIPEESLAQLFTPFYRVEQSRNRKSGGSGLGLYLTKNILDLHDATCKMENTAQGVRFAARFR